MGVIENASQESTSAGGDKNKMLEDHVYCIGTTNQASEYFTITQFIINHIGKEFEWGDDIGNALESGEE